MADKIRLRQSGVGGLVGSLVGSVGRWVGGSVDWWVGGSVGRWIGRLVSWWVDGCLAICPRWVNPFADEIMFVQVKMEPEPSPSRHPFCLEPPFTKATHVESYTVW